MKRKLTTESIIKNRARRMLAEGEIENAQAALAAKDLVDRLQDTIQELGKMSNDELPHLIDAIRSSFGQDAASNYQTKANDVLTSLLDQVKQKKGELENATLVLTGDATAEEPSDLNLPDESDEEAPDLDDEDISATKPMKKNPLGRETRMPTEESLRRKFRGKTVTESYNKNLQEAKIVAINKALKETNAKKFPTRAKRLAEELKTLVTEAIKQDSKKKAKKKSTGKKPAWLTAAEKKAEKKEGKKVNESKSVDYTEYAREAIEAGGGFNNYGDPNNESHGDWESIAQDFAAGAGINAEILYDAIHRYIRTKQSAGVTESKMETKKCKGCAKKVIGKGIYCKNCKEDMNESFGRSKPNNPDYTPSSKCKNCDSTYSEHKGSKLKPKCPGKSSTFFKREK